MILRSIQAEGWRCFVSSVHIGPFIDGLNIIHGPNGIGKSTLMTALARGLFDNHHVGGADIQTLRSWGRQLAPKVTIEFEQNGERFQLHKQFLDSPSAKISREENGRYTPVAESRAADERARKILSGEVSGRGASDQRHWGLAQILWATQGRLKIDYLATGTHATIQEALGAQVTGAGTGILEQKIADRYGRFFTGKGRLRSGASAPAIVGLESQLAKEKSAHADCQQRLLEFDAASRRIEDLRRQTETARQNEQDLNGKLKEARDQVQAFQKLVAERKQYQLEVSTASKDYRNLAERIEAIRQARADQQAITGKLKQLREDLPARQKLVEQFQEDAGQAGQKVRQIRGQRSDVTAASQRAQLAERFARSQGNRLELEKLLQQVEATQTEIGRLRQSREPLVAPDKKTLAEIIRVARQRDDARLQLDAALITVTLQLESETGIEVVTAEEPGRRTVAQDVEHEIRGAPDVAIHIPDIGKIRATGPTGDFDTLREQWESAAARFAELTAGFGTRDLTALESLHAQAAELDQQLAQREVKLVTLLDGNEIDSIRSDYQLAKRTLDEICRDQPAWTSEPPDPAGLSRQADEIAARFARDLDEAEATDGRAREALQTGSQQLADYESKIANNETQAAALEKRLESLRNDGLDDQQRSGKLTEIALQRDASAGKLAEVEKHISQLGDDPSKSLAMLEQQQAAYRQEADEAGKKLNTETGRLEQIVSEAPYSSLAGVEEEIARLEGEIARQRLQIDAIRLLHETVTQQKREVVQTLIEPVRLRANLILQRISGSQFDNVHFDETLLPTGISPRSSEDSVALEQISGGEQEQVHFAVRMALAEVAFPNDRQLVVLDDVFTYTDASRLARIATLLEEAAERFQIVLLTCHPERYRGLPNTSFFDLQEISSSRRSPPAREQDSQR